MWQLRGAFVCIDGGEGTFPLGSCTVGLCRVEDVEGLGFQIE